MSYSPEMQILMDATYGPKALGKISPLQFKETTLDQSYEILRDGNIIGTMCREKEQGNFWVIRDSNKNQLMFPDMYRHDLMERFATKLRCSFEILRPGAPAAKKPFIP